MQYDVECKSGKCKYKYRSLFDECIDCDEIAQIEHNLFREQFDNI